MEISRSSTPEAPPQDLWSSILDSVSSSRSTPSKQILLLGQPLTGKSTLASALLQKPIQDEEKEDNRSDFAIGYDFADVRDEADEGKSHYTLARLSVYTVPSASTSYTSLLPHFLPPRQSLPHTLVMITLDWTRPWSFVEELQIWLQWVEKWAKGDGLRELEMAREEGRERLQSHLQHYAEPSTDQLPANSALSGTVLPLGQGTFTHNTAGIPIIITCTKADLIDDGNDMAAGASGMGSMVKGKGGEWEERTDGVMQVLRTVCLKFLIEVTDGASLFYTTTVPSTLQVLRQYALHALFMPPAPSPVASGEPQAPARNIFPFNHKPNTLDRDRIVVPAGWDSWGKISVMRDGFEAKLWGEAWERDLTDDHSEGTGARSMYATLVPDQGTKPPPLPPFNDPTPEQAFLAKNYDENAKKPDRDPRGAFRNPTDLAGATAGIVGPLGSSSFSLPNVERALTEMEVGIAGAPGAGPPTDSSKRASRNPVAPSGRPAGLSPVGTSAPTSGRGPSSPPPTGGSASPTGGQTQHEVLQNFFQSLLSSKDRTGTPTSVRTATPTAKTNGNEGGTEDGNTGA
ncbi:hypothetical protein DXG01_007652 [Tephrocybe rancida]|nr:hypothetical protein DXG01_007652 [Tephrocybe rancida]